MNRMRPWFLEDIESILRSVLFSVRGDSSLEFKEGFLACAVAVLLAMGGNPDNLKVER